MLVLSGKVKIKNKKKNLYSDLIKWLKASISCEHLRSNKICIFLFAFRRETVERYLKSMSECEGCRYVRSALKEFDIKDSLGAA